MKKTKHAEVRIGEFDHIPLIGVPEWAALEECDLCHDLFYIGDVEFNGKQYLCKKCNYGINEDSK